MLVYETSRMHNEPNKHVGLPEFYYRWRNCDTNLNSNTPANRYQKLKLIQNTVRVPSSIYTMNLGSLSAYQRPIEETHNVCWNQMSDRVLPSVQRATIPTGFYTSANRRHTSVTSSRPGCQTPGGIGCDIKHNSYDRYLNRLKGKGPLRRGFVPPTFGSPSIPFNPAYPVYGGKTMKTNIVNGCDCPDIYVSRKDANNLPDKVKEVENENKEQNMRLYYNPLYQKYPVTEITYGVGSMVYAIQDGTDFYKVATVISVNDNIYVVQFEDGTTQSSSALDLVPYFYCECGSQYHTFQPNYELPYFIIKLSSNYQFLETCPIPILALYWDTIKNNFIIPSFNT